MVEAGERDVGSQNGGSGSLVGPSIHPSPTPARAPAITTRSLLPYTSRLLLMLMLMLMLKLMLALLQ